MAPGNTNRKAKQNTNLLDFNPIIIKTPRELGPGKFFDMEEKKIWRNSAKWAVPPDALGEVWINLPGPADFWPEDSASIDTLGFYIPHGKDITYKAMADMIFNDKMNEKRIFAKYKLIENDEEFRLRRK